MSILYLHYQWSTVIENEDLLVPNDKDLWSNYGITVDNGFDSANQYINDIVEKDMKAHYKYWLDGASHCRNDYS